MDLVLTDARSESLHRFADELEDEGYSIAAALPGDLDDNAMRARLVRAASHGQGLGALVHTTGLRAAEADWKSTLCAESLNAIKLIEAIDTLIRPGTVAVMITSAAGYVDLQIPIADAILQEAVHAEQLDPIGPMLFFGRQAGPQAEADAAEMAHVLSQRAVMRLCERKARAWGARGARIVSISCAGILTAVDTQQLVNASTKPTPRECWPINRWGTSMDIAAAVSFLTSPAASFITGCDLRVDGGATARSRSAW